MNILKDIKEGKTIKIKTDENRYSIIKLIKPNVVQEVRYYNDIKVATIDYPIKTIK